MSLGKTSIFRWEPLAWLNDGLRIYSQYHLLWNQFFCGAAMPFVWPWTQSLPLTRLPRKIPGLWTLIAAVCALRIGMGGCSESSNVSFHGMPCPYDSSNHLKNIDGKKDALPIRLQRSWERSIGAPAERSLLSFSGSRGYKDPAQSITIMVPKLDTPLSRRWFPTLKASRRPFWVILGKPH
jgi:hypothetical protein